MQGRKKDSNHLNVTGGTASQGVCCQACSSCLSSRVNSGLGMDVDCQSVSIKLLTLPWTRPSIFMSSAMNPMLGDMLGRALMTWRYAFLSVQRSEVTKYARMAVTDRDLPALQ